MIEAHRITTDLIGLLLLTSWHGVRADDRQPGAIKAADVAVAEDLAKLKGPWRAVRGELSGEPRQESFLLTFDDATWMKQGKTKTEKGVFHLNPSTAPKQIDILKEDGKRKWLLGIYAIEGDRLRFCFGPERPDELTTKPGQNAVLLEFRREPGAQVHDGPDK
jgi:uncharacterized protein (TIGR03067 family)